MTKSTDPGLIRPGFEDCNADFQWDTFDSASYVSHNYSRVHSDDLMFIAEMRDFFATQLSGRGELRGVDIGAGCNLYPSLAMLPFCSDIDLIDFATSNVAWMNQEVREYTENWDPFWEILAAHPTYAAVEEPRLALKERAHVEQGSVFRLPQDKWDIGTLFFVAESISQRIEEFRSSVSSFIGALRPGAPFAAAFMENSRGYVVGSQEFPAVMISDSDVKYSLEELAEVHSLSRLAVGANPLREGYTGMMLVCGKRLGEADL